MNRTEQNRTETLFDKNTYELHRFQLPQIVRQRKYIEKERESQCIRIQVTFIFYRMISFENRLNTSYTFTFTVPVLKCLKLQTCSSFGGFSNRRHFRQPIDVLISHQIVRWKHRAIDILSFEFNVGPGNGAI